MGEIAELKKSPLKHGLFCFSLAFVLAVVPVSAAGSLRVEKVSESVSVPSLNCRVSYPHIDGISNLSRQERLNVALKESAKTVETKARYDAKFGNVNADVDFIVTRNNNSIMSLVVKGKISSGKSESLSQTGLTIDTVTGRRYLLADLFIDNADYVETLSNQIKTQIARSGLDKRQVKEFKRISENEDFYLTSDSVIVFFEQGEYFSSDCAVREFAIPLETLAGILKPQVRLA
ncbi:MAG TPA: DUF3298 domain-containing protein [Ruminiclostridium sp.]|nr:DUF3298 domain-containing protein [Ruminiclostridium sp.]